MLTKTKNIRKKKNRKCFFFPKFQKRPGHVAQDNQEIKFESNPWDMFRDNRCHRRTTDGRTDDGRQRNFVFMTSADIVKQS